MICQKCKEQGLKSHVYGGIGSITCVHYTPFYDEDGQYHSHDGNTRTSSFRCSNGHEWTEYSTGFCPAPDCDWNKDRETKIVWHEYEKEQHVGFHTIRLA